MNETSRASFLATGMAGALLASADPASAAVPAGVAGLDSLEAVLHKPAKHKQVIAAPKVNGGAPLRYALNTLNAFQNTYGEGPSAVHVAVVFYGPGLFIAANDSLWERYRLFDVLDAVNDGLPPTVIHTPSNPFLASVNSLMQRGVSFLVCNNALTELSRQAAVVEKTDQKTVYDDFRRNIVPGAIVVPAGVAALVLAQEAGFAFLSG